MKSANDYDWAGEEATSHLVSLSDRKLSKRLDIVREQRGMALKAGKVATAENLQAHEDAIIRARMGKL